MLDIKFIKENKEVVQNAINNKKVAGKIDLDELLRLADEKKALRQEIDVINQRRNEAAKIRDISGGAKAKTELAIIEDKVQSVDKKLMALMLLLPNIPSPDTPIGPDESYNKVIRQVGEKPTFSFTPKDHSDIGKDLDIIDNERAGIVSGARFTYLKGDLVLMQYALLSYTFDLLTDKSKLETIAKEANLNIPITTFIPVVPPVFVKPAVMNRMARLEPKEERYYVPSGDLYLIGSAEHTLGPMHMDETFTESQLPLRYVGFSNAFRREAGSYGKDTKGILRMHQFDKIEMETFTLPEHSYQEQDFIIAIQETLMKGLKLAYQVVSICTGDMGLPDHRQMDIETWMPGQNKYRETHTSDLMGGFQARRLNTRVKRADGKTEHVHMNDATAFAMGRTLIAIIENYQQEDGTIKIPEVLQKYMGGRTVIGKRN